MTTDVDERLRAGLRALAPDGATAPQPSAEEVAHDVGRRVARRRRRRHAARAAAGAVAVLALAAGAMGLAGDNGPDAVTADRPSAGADRRPEAAPPAPARPVDVVGVDAYGGVEGTSRLVVTFDGPVPEGELAYLPDIREPGVAADRLSWTTQQPGAVRVCGDRHSFPGTLGTVDVLIPEAWLVPKPAGWWRAEVPFQAHEVDGVAPAKVVTCGPYRGYVQVGLWGPAADHPYGVDVTVAAAGTQLVVELGSLLVGEG